MKEVKTDKKPVYQCGKPNPKMFYSASGVDTRINLNGKYMPGVQTVNIFRYNPTSPFYQGEYPHYYPRKMEPGLYVEIVMVDFGDNPFPEYWEGQTMLSLELFHTFGEQLNEVFRWKKLDGRLVMRAGGVSIDDIVSEERWLIKVDHFDFQRRLATDEEIANIRNG